MAQPLTPEAARKLFGYANDFKEGDATIHVAAPADREREKARALLSSLRLGDIKSEDFVEDEVTMLSKKGLDDEAHRRTLGWTVGELRAFLLRAPEEEIKAVAAGLTSEVIAAVCKLMTNAELKIVSSKIYNPLPNSTVGAKGYFGSRLQPNSPTDDPEEILFATLEGLSYGCGDVILGINPVASDHPSVTALEKCMRRVWEAFKLQDKTTYCVLAHIDDQAAVDDGQGLVQCLFQSIGGNASINQTFNVTNAKLHSLLQRVKRQYFETGQGSAVTNGVAGGVDMVTLESRAYGLARALKKMTGSWTIVNDVAGFIGPEVFRSPAQLTRACLEDLFMGKLHGLTMGLDICSTYHMGVSIEEIERVQEEVMEAGTAYYMAVPGRNDPMLSYITTGFRDHPRLRKKFGRQVSKEMKSFFEEVGIMTGDGELTQNGGNTAYMYMKLRQAEGDSRPPALLIEEADRTLKKLQARGLDLGYGHDGTYGMPSHIKEKLFKLYNNAKEVIYLSLSEGFEECRRKPLVVSTVATNREEYVLRPVSGEQLSNPSILSLKRFRVEEIEANHCNAVIIFSDGLNAHSLERPDQVSELVKVLEAGCAERGLKLAREIVLRNGRVRAGYAIGQLLFGGAPLTTKYGSAGEEKKREEVKERATVFHIIGERPGNGNNTYSVYISSVDRKAWELGITHDVVKVVCGISYSALHPKRAGADCLDVVDELLKRPSSRHLPTPPQLTPSTSKRSVTWSKSCSSKSLT